MTYEHDWKPSTLGHGESMCARCFITNREAAVLGELNSCFRPPSNLGGKAPAKEASAEPEGRSEPLLNRPATEGEG